MTRCNNKHFVERFKIIFVSLETLKLHEERKV